MKVDIDEMLDGIVNDSIEASARLLEKLGGLPNLHTLSVPQFAKIAAADIRALKRDDDHRADKEQK